MVIFLKELRCRRWWPVFIGLILRLINLQLPIVGVHSWRQADTAAMARHFALEGSPIWLPEIDWGGAGFGYVESEFPLYPYLLGQIYKFSGVNEWIGRLLSVLFSTLTIFLIIRIGSKLLDSESGWWAGLFFAVSPLSIYYGRTLQAESLMMLLSALSLERMLIWKEELKGFNFLISWLFFSLACLIKVLPFVWLFPAIVAINICHYSRNLKINLYRAFSSPSLYLYFIGSFLLAIAWYSYAYNLGRISGHSFGFWGETSDRSSLIILFDLKIWIDLTIRIIVRNFAVFGFPIFLLGCSQLRNKSASIVLFSGIGGCLIATMIALKASYVHEYYQLPLMLFICPVFGTGVVRLINLIEENKSVFYKLCNYILPLILLTSITIMSFDYWSLERQQAQIWMPLANRIRNNLPDRSRIVSVTGHDPTLLNLSRRRGWLTSSKGIAPKQIRYWVDQGATHIVGSLDWEETYVKRLDSNERSKLRSIVCGLDTIEYCSDTKNGTYLVPINKLIQE